MKNQRGFSLVELLITMVIFVFAIVAVANIFLGLLNQFKQQSKIAETNIEGLVGLKMLKADIEQAGYGLPYDINGADYDEASGLDILTIGFNATAYNDSGAPGNPPRGLLIGDRLTMTNRSDVLVVKATNVAINDAAQKWAYMTNNGAASTITAWTNAAGANIADENFTNGDLVTILRPVQGAAQRILQVSGGTFFATFNNINILTSDLAPATNSFQTYLIYGISGTANPIMPFNRADYYVRIPTATPMPTQCAPGTGIFYKGTINHTAGGGSHSELPLLDCVAAMKVVLARDTNADGIIDNYLFNAAWPVGTTAADIRSQLKEIRIYILLHEGQRDVNYTYTAQGADLLLGADHIGIRDPQVGLAPGQELLDYTVPDRNYRWKIYSMVITPYNLR
ncbi:MAG: prepilin-type N-terminal cleavage/methylation domain-containing protein [Nitrospirota bacterium]|nr:prepilin-type N-terminal cleavage/methylation domain-containing protein [Nitrospirota bacterium]